MWVCVGVCVCEGIRQEVVTVGDVLHNGLSLSETCNSQNHHVQSVFMSTLTTLEGSS